MTPDSDPRSDSDSHWQQEAIDRAMERIEAELSELQRDATGPQREAVKRGRELVDELERVLRTAASGDPPEEDPPYEQGDGVDVSEARKRP